MNKLRLGPVEEDRPVKLTIEIPGKLHRALADYASVHANANGLGAPLPPERLVAPMLERFIGADREFARQRRKG